EDRGSLLKRYDEASALLPSETLIIQEMVPGGGEAQFSYAALCKDGRSLASVVARRTRQFPRDFGQFSTYVETIDAPEIVEPAERLLAAVHFTGLAEVEFKRDPRDGQFNVLDINPRVWGWHTLSRRAGVDFPYLLWLLTRGEPVPRLRGRPGERWVHLSADLGMAIEEILGGRLSLLEYLRSIRGPLESARKRSEEHTSELQSRSDLVCRLLLEKKNTENTSYNLCLIELSIHIYTIP